MKIIITESQSKMLTEGLFTSGQLKETVRKQFEEWVTEFHESGKEINDENVCEYLHSKGDYDRNFFITKLHEMLKERYL